MGFRVRGRRGCVGRFVVHWDSVVGALRSHESKRRTQQCVGYGLACLLLCGLTASAEVVRIGVFHLFHPTELRVSPAAGALLMTSGDARVVLEGRQSQLIRLGRISSPVRVSARDGSAADFRLSIPGKIERQFYGTLTVSAGDHRLVAVVTMDREVAVASVVAAEMPPGAPIQALKAQAVVARSYFAASRARHDDVEFCDTTHCQFLREWPGPSSAAFRATQETRDLLLAFRGVPFAALYSASCGGQTRALEDPDSGYPYRSVPCEYCSRHTPGTARGHQLGLCQAGAAGMARAGAGFREILNHYFPATSLIQNPSNAIFFLPPRLALRHSRVE